MLTVSISEIKKKKIMHDFRKAVDFLHINFNIMGSAFFFECSVILEVIAGLEVLSDS